MQSGESFEDYGSLTEVPATPELDPPPRVSMEGAVLPRAAGTEKAQAAGPAPTASPSTAQPGVAPSSSPPPAGPGRPSATTPMRPPVPSDDESAGSREPIVPRGTFASEVPDRSQLGEDRDPARGNGARASMPTRTPSVRPVQRPPYLASEILREDLTPSEPGWRLMNMMVQLAPALGALAVLTSGLKRVSTWVAIAAFIALFGTARLELSYNMRALIVALIGGAMLSLVTVWRTALGGGVDGPLLALVITFLPAALLFRAWFRAAYTARVLVSLALVLAATWAAATSNRQLLALEFEWQSWLPALAWYLFCLLGLLALLAFMGDETTGGCDAWALGLLVWYGLFACVRFAIETENGLRMDGDLYTLGLAEPALAAPTAVALAQLLARVLGARSPRAPAAHAT